MRNGCPSAHRPSVCGALAPLVNDQRLEAHISQLTASDRYPAKHGHLAETIPVRPWNLGFDRLHVQLSR
jgi:hypothetical protein